MQISIKEKEKARKEGRNEPLIMLSNASCQKFSTTAVHFRQMALPELAIKYCLLKRFDMVFCQSFQ